MAESLITIEGIHPTIDGEYPISIGGFTNRDFRDIKRISGVRPQELGEAFEKRDMELFVAFAVIALRHAGKSVIEDMLWDAPVGKIKLSDGDEAEVDDLPPVSAPPSEAPSESGGVEKPSDTSANSGVSSSNGSGHPESDPSRIGLLDSGTGATSPSLTSVN